MIARIRRTPALDAREATASSSSRCCGFWPRSRRSRRSSPSTSSTPRPRSRCMTSGCRPRRWRAPRSSSPSIRSASTRRRRRRAAASRSASATPPSRPISVPRRRASISTPRRRSCSSGLFVGLGAPRGQRTTMRTASSPGARRPARARRTKAPIYRAAGLLYSPRGAPFQHVAELGLVLGIPEAMVERAMPFVTVYSASRASTSDGRGAAGARRAARHGPGAGSTPSWSSAPARPAATRRAAGACSAPRRRSPATQGSKAMRVTARIAFDSGQRMTTEAVIFILDSGTEAYRVLTWRDESTTRRPNAAGSVTR